MANPQDAFGRGALTIACEVSSQAAQAGFLESQRGAHGGYRLGRSADEIEMLEAVQALEGAIAPIQCFLGDS